MALMNGLKPLFYATIRCNYHHLCDRFRTSECPNNITGCLMFHITPTIKEEAENPNKE